MSNAENVQCWWIVPRAHAAAIPEASQSFKFQINDPKKGLFYLADASGAGTTDEAEALTCELNADVITCDGKGFPNFQGDMTKLSTTGSSSGWSIDSSDNIHWDARPEMKFSVGIGSSNDMYAEVCPDMHGHFTGQHGTAKAVYV